MLVIVTILWGLSFPLMKNWQDAADECPGGKSVASCTLIALRMMLALLVFAVVRPQLFIQPSRREHRIGLLIGGIFFLGFVLQVRGLASTTPALSGFITSLGSAWVPLLASAWFRLAPARLTLLGIGLGVAGTFVLGMTDLEGDSWGEGEGLTLLASWLFAVEVLLLDRLGRTVESAHLTVSFLALSGGLALILAAMSAAGEAGVGAWLSWTARMLQNASMLRDLGLLTLLSTVLAFHWMNVYQPRVGANRAALIYLLEPVFSAVFSLIGGHDSWSLRLVVGGGLVLGGNFLVELPAWLRSPPFKTRKTSEVSETSDVCR
jgi:drug/metabolite transporter (DMT)-like permease